MYKNPTYKTTSKQPRKTESMDNNSNKFDIRNGRFEQYLGNGKEPEPAKYVSGRLKRISLRTHQKGQIVYNFMDIYVEKDGKEICISGLYPSSVMSEMISHLVNVQDTSSELKLSVWQAGKYVNCSVWERGHVVAHSNLPKVSKTKKGGTIQVDTSARDAVVLEYVKRINRKLGISA